MNNNTLLTFIVIAIAGVVLFVFPIMTISEKNDKVAMERIQAETTAFVDRIANEGELTEKALNEFESTINTLRPVYTNIELQQIDENIGKKTSFGTSTVIGSNTYYTTYNETIRDAISKNGKIPFKQGDIVSVEVGYTTKEGFAEGIKSAISGITGNGSYEPVARATSEVKINGSAIE